MPRPILPCNSATRCYTRAPGAAPGGESKMNIQICITKGTLYSTRHDIAHIATGRTSHPGACHHSKKTQGNMLGVQRTSTSRTRSLLNSELGQNSGLGSLVTQCEAFVRSQSSARLMLLLILTRGFCPPVPFVYTDLTLQIRLS